MRYILTILMMGLGLLSAVSTADLQWLLDTEQFGVLAQYEEDIQALLDGSETDLKLALDYARKTANLPLELRCHDRLALRFHSLDNALQWFETADVLGLDSLVVTGVRGEMESEFSSAEDKVILDYFLYGTPEEEYLEQIRQLRGYNPFIENLAKSWIDEISVEPSDSLALEMIGRFEYYFPVSKWEQVAYYYRLYHLSRILDYGGVNTLIALDGNKTPAHQYISTLFLMSPSFRRTQPASDNAAILYQAEQLLAGADTSQQDGILLLYDLYTPLQWSQRIKLMRVKLGYYKLLADLGLYGDEEDTTALLKKTDSRYRDLLAAIDGVDFPDNDRGDIAEKYFWAGKVQSLPQKPKSLLAAAKSYTQSLVWGAPRRKYDPASLLALEQLRSKLQVKADVSAWTRALAGYKGIVFVEHPFPDKRYTRIAIGDYDNDGFNDLLFNGSALYHNDSGKGFSSVSDSTALASLRSNGALWADFNLDGKLDFATISHDSEGLGEALMKNQDGGRFVKVNERAGDIDDRYPTEGAAWIDIDGLGYPSFYAANYEKWQERSGFPDFFWYNDGGYFSDASVNRGFRQPVYADNPGQAGRGVAPADFDNDGQQEILVTNYRLNRNFCWKQADSLYVDVAALYGLSGKYKEGYYGHSIGADWGDYDNDGDLDLFIANLAHPRYIDISDISQLLRNDGMSYRVIEADTLWYWKFTDVTREAGITYDELHSDPLWLDADNDGWLDLFVTSVYENDRSYLYRNNGDGTFSDITFLSGARVYNGWGNATADLDRDGRTDLVVGSGNGTKILLNRSKTKNRSLFVKPVWKAGEIVLASDPGKFSHFPNSPAFGARVEVTFKPGSNGHIRKLIRELCSAKGTTSQNSQELHFGLGRGKVETIKLIDYAQDPD